MSVSPVDLLPKDANGISFQLKRVDTGLFLNPNPFVSTKIGRKLMMLPVEEQSINQTTTAFFRSRPLLASFGLKRTTPATDPLVQLGIWSVALSERLRKLQRPEDKESDLMAIPAITVVGHAWTLYYSYTTEEGDRVSFNDRSHYARRKANGQCRCYMALALSERLKKLKASTP